MVQLAAFPKCFLDDIIVYKSMTLFDWLEPHPTRGSRTRATFTSFGMSRCPGKQWTTRDHAEAPRVSRPRLLDSSNF